MNKTILIWMIATLSLIPVALAQTGLFTQAGQESFVLFGVTTLLIILVAFTIIENFRKKK